MFQLSLPNAARCMIEMMHQIRWRNKRHNAKHRVDIRESAASRPSWI